MRRRARHAAQLGRLHTLGPLRQVARHCQTRQSVRRPVARHGTRRGPAAASVVRVCSMLSHSVSPAGALSPRRHARPGTGRSWVVLHCILLHCIAARCSPSPCSVRLWDLWARGKVCPAQLILGRSVAVDFRSGGRVYCCPGRPLTPGTGTGSAAPSTGRNRPGPSEFQRGFTFPRHRSARRLTSALAHAHAAPAATLLCSLTQARTSAAH